MKAPLVQVRDLQKHYPVKRGLLRRQVATIAAVDGLTFDIAEGETLGLVGESGCGKSTLGRTILRLVEPTCGERPLTGADIVGLSPEPMRALRREMQIIFQDPYASLNPRMTVGEIVGEAIEIHGLGEGRGEARARARAADQGGPARR